MIDFKKIALVCLILLIVTTFAACNGSSGDTEVTTTSPAEITTMEGGNVTDDPADTDPVDVSFAFRVKDTEGAPLAAVKLSLLVGSEVMFEGESDANGEIKGTILSGKYTVSYDFIPEGYQPEEFAPSVDITADFEGELIFKDITPDGTVEKPFPLQNGDNEYTLEAGATYNYILYRPGDRIITIENANVELKYLDTVYTPDANGKIELQFESTDSLREAATLTVTNKSAQALTLKLTLSSPLGSTDNPIAITELGTQITAQVKPDAIVYYSYVAKKTGVLMVSSATEYNNIALVNKNTSSVSSFTSGRACEFLTVTAGDEIGVNVSATGSSKDTRDVIFTLAEYAADENDPIVIAQSSFGFALRKDASCAFAFNASGKTLTIKGEGVKAVLNGNEYTPDAENKIVITLTEGAVVKLENTSDKTAELTFAVE